MVWVEATEVCRAHYNRQHLPLCFQEAALTQSQSTSAHYFVISWASPPPLSYANESQASTEPWQQRAELRCSRGPSVALHFWQGLPGLFLPKFTKFLAGREGPPSSPLTLQGAPVPPHEDENAQSQALNAQHRKNTRSFHSWGVTCPSMLRSF